MAGRPMSNREELVRSLFERWNAGEREADPAVMDPELEIHSHMTGTVWRGYAGLLGWATEIDQQFEAWRLGIDELRVLDDGRVLAVGSIEAQGRQSGIDLDQPAAWIIEIRDDRLLRLHNNIGRQAVDAVLSSVG
jgi:ketosteroid isomerase-like protein